MSENKYGNFVFEDPSAKADTTNLPSADGGIISVPAAAIVAGAGLIYKVGVDWVPKLKSETAIIVKFLSSEPPAGTSSNYTASFSIENVSMHTVYVEAIEVTRPNAGTEVRRITVSKMGWDSPSPPPPLPWKITAGESISFVIGIDKNRLPLDVEKNPYGLFKIETSILHQKSTNSSKDIVFRIRGY